MKRVFRVEVERDDNEVGDMLIYRCLVNHEDTLSRPCKVCVTEITDTEPDELKVGDPVETSSGYETTIEEIKTGYQLKDGSMKFIGLWSRDELTKLPLKPAYRVERRDDFLYLMWLPPDKTAWEVHTRVAMDDPEKIVGCVEAWPRHYGIDRDELQKLVDEPREIGRYGLANHVVCIATRYAKGWQAVCRGRIQTEHLAQAMFPKIIGPYLDKP